MFSLSVGGGRNACPEVPGSPHADRPAPPGAHPRPPAHAMGVCASAVGCKGGVGPWVGGGAEGGAQAVPARVAITNPPKSTNWISERNSVS